MSKAQDPVQNVERLVKSWAQENPVYPVAFAEGFRTFAKSSIDVFRVPKVRKAFKKQAFALLGVSVGLFIAGYLLMYPVYVLLKPISMVFNISSIYAMLARVQRHLFAVTSPVLVIGFVTLFMRRTLDKLFFAYLHKINRPYAERLKSLHPLPTTTVVRKKSWRLVRYLAGQFGLIFVRHVPVIGYFLTPLMQVAVLRHHLGWQRSALFAAFSLVPFVSDVAATILHYYFAVLTLSREFLDPYFLRTQETQREEWRLMRKHEALIVGFSLPMLFLTSLPLIGPLMYTIGCAAVAALVLDIAPEEPTQPLESQEQMVREKRTKIQKEGYSVEKAKAEVRRIADEIEEKGRSAVEDFRQRTGYGKSEREIEEEGGKRLEGSERVKQDDESGRRMTRAMTAAESEEANTTTPVRVSDRAAAWERQSHEFEGRATQAAH